MGTSSQGQTWGEAGLLWTPDQDSAAGGDGPVGSPVDRRGLEGNAHILCCFRNFVTSDITWKKWATLWGCEMFHTRRFVLWCCLARSIEASVIWVYLFHPKFHMAATPASRPCFSAKLNQELIVPITTRVDILHGAGAGWGLISTNLSQDWMLNRNARLLTFLGRENCQATWNMHAGWLAPSSLSTILESQVRNWGILVMLTASVIALCQSEVPGKQCSLSKGTALKSKS